MYVSLISTPNPKSSYKSINASPEVLALGAFVVSTIKSISTLISYDGTISISETSGINSFKFDAIASTTSSLDNSSRNAMQSSALSLIN